MSQLKDDIMVGLAFLMGVQVPLLVILYVIWSAGYL
jgi:hypothetical protein